MLLVADGIVDTWPPSCRKRPWSSAAKEFVLLYNHVRNVFKRTRNLARAHAYVHTKIYMICGCNACDIWFQTAYICYWWRPTLVPVLSSWIEYHVVILILILLLRCISLCPTPSKCLNIQTSYTDKCRLAKKDMNIGNFDSKQ